MQHWIKKISASVLASLALGVVCMAPAVAAEAKENVAKENVMTKQDVVAQIQSLQILNAWARASVAKGQNSAAYFVLRNDSARDDVLLSAASDAAKVVELHTHVHDRGVMRMRQIPSIPVKAHMDTAFMPSGLHVMLIDLKEKLSEGDEISLTLEFAQAGKVSFKVPVRAIATMPPKHHAH